ncbi:MAG: 3(2),5-bisphosphate nucleotidase CysQ [Sphingomonadales bacterium]|nr:3(2),5-bisphosphate nucleotidase CysQ [Sphingomonadales bacterium]
MSLLSQVSEAARAAGAMAFARWRGEFASWDKVPGEIVCEIDLAANDMLRQALNKLDPEAGWFSEETADSAERLLGSRVWVVDPIDGTRDFVRGRPGWAVSVALCEGGRAVLGVLDAPARNEHWAAELGKGATLNGEPLHASQRTELPGARVPADVLPKADADLTMVFRPNSIALRMAMVASGEADLLAAIRWGHEWDIAAATLIAQEAGATVTDARGQTLRFNSTKGEMFGVLCCAPGIHAAAVERLRERAVVAVVR